MTHTHRPVRTLVTVVAAAATTLGVIVAPLTASALGASCSSWTETRSRSGLDEHRAVVRCTSVNSDSKVRATLDRAGAPDGHSGWLKSAGTASTGWYTCYAGCRDRYDIAAR